MDVRLPNGTILRNVPDDATKASIFEKLQSNGIDPTTLGLEEPKQAFAGLRQAADIPLGLAKGFATGVRSLSDAFGANNEFSQNVKGVEDLLGEYMSAQYRKDAAAQQEILAKAKDKGVLANLQASWEYLKVAPVDTIANLAGTSAPYILGAIYGGPAAGIALGAIGGAGAVKGDIYDAVKQELTANTNLSAEEVEARAQAAQETNGANLDQILLGAGIGAVAGSTGIEAGAAKFISSNILKRVTEKQTAEQLAAQTAKKLTETGAKEGFIEVGGDRLSKRFIKGAAVEAVPEATQEGQEQVARNVALQREGVNVPTMEGVTQAATLGGTLGAIMGGPLEAVAGEGPRRIKVQPEAKPGETQAPGAEPAPEEPVIPGVQPAPEPTEVPPTAVEPAPPTTPEVEPPVAVEPPPVDVKPAPEPEAPPAIEPAPTPTPAAPKPGSPYLEGDPLEGDHLNLPIFSLPKPLAGAKPKYNYKSGMYAPFFFNDVDKALFIVAQPQKSSKDAEYRAFLKSVGFDDNEINIRSKEARQHIKNLAAANFNAGKKSGLIPIDFSRLSSFYPNVISKAGITEAPAVPPSAAPAPTPTVAPKPATTTAKPKAPVVPPAIPAAPSVQQNPFVMKVTPSVRKTLESNIPGVVGILETIQQNLFPGAPFELKIKKQKSGVKFEKFGQIKSFKKNGIIQHEIAIFEENIKKRFKNATPEKILQTLFHEYSHAAHYYWVNTADAVTQAEIFAQFAKERSADAARRFAFVEFLKGNLQLTGKPIDLDQVLQKVGLTKQQYNDLLAMQSTSIPSQLRVDNFSDKYVRSYNEWAAEKGAAWLAKEIEGRTPKTVFEKFQATVLQGLRNVYRAVAGSLGITPTEGAFEKLLADIWGNKVNVPSPVFVTPYTSKSGQVAQEQVVASSEKVEPTTTQVPPSLEELSTLMTSTTPVNDDAWYTKPLADFIGREKIVVNGKLVYEPVSRAIIRNTVAANLPFLEKPAFREVGKLLESLQNMQGRMVGMIKYGYLTYNPETGELDFKSFTGTDDPNNLEGGLAKLFERAGAGREKDLQVLTIAMRQRDLILNKKPRLHFINPNTKRPFTLDELNQVIKNAPADLKEIAENYRKFNAGMLKFALDSGIITKEMADTFLSTMYTPFYKRQDAATKGDSNLTLSPDMKDVLENPDNITNFSKKLGEGAKFEELDPDFYANVFKNYSAIVTMGLKNIAYNAVAKAALGETGVNDPTLIEAVGKGGEGIITYRVDGNEKHMKVNDLPMFQALASFSPKQLEGWARAAQRFTDLLRTAITSMPGFQLANMWRGIVDTHIKTGMPLGELARETFKLMGTGFWESLRKGYLSNSSYKAIIAQQGFGGYNIGSRAKDQAEFMRRQFAMSEGTATYKQRVLTMLDRLEEMGEVSEMAPRIAYYNWLSRPKDKGGMGLSHKAAAYEAMNLVNFGRSGTGKGVFGSGIAFLIPLVPFLNARIQGLYRLAEANTAGGGDTLNYKFKKTDAPFGFQKAVILRGLILTALEAALLAAFGDDDWYDKLSVEDKVTNNYVRVGDTIIAFPRPFELGSVYGAIPMLFHDALKKEQSKEFTDGFMYILMQTFSFNAIPQAVKPLIDVYYANRDSFTGQQIETISEQKRPENERMDEYTTEMAKIIAKGVPGLSPKQADALIRGYLGTFGTVMAGAIDGLLAESGTKPEGYFGDPTSPLAVLANTAGLNRFFKGEETMRNRYVKDFYNVQRTVEEITTSIKDAVDAKDFELVREKIKDDPRAKALATSLNRTESSISQINIRMRSIRNNPNLSSSQKTEYLNKLRKQKNELAQRAYEIAKKVGYE